jgi:PhzF family phenazine biosynthesis protein
MILYYEVHAFTNRIFGGNPAGVCPLEEWLEDDLMQRIARENNLSETAFFVRNDGVFDLRWFTPAIEVDLCGHATLASAYVLFDHLEHQDEIIRFRTMSGELAVWKDGPLLVMDFPSRPGEPTVAPDALALGLGRDLAEVYKARDYLVVLKTQEEVLELQPDFAHLAEVECTGIIVTAPGDEVDFVSRFFDPQAGVPEDPVTGSAHSTLTPYWAERLGKTALAARQISTRGGELWCRQVEDRVHIAGQAALYLKGFLSAD